MYFLENSRLLKKSSFPGCSKRARCKAPSLLRVASRRIRSDLLPRRRVGESDRGVLGGTPQRRRMRETRQMAIFQRPVKKLAGGRGVEPRFAESESGVLPLNDPPPTGYCKFQMEGLKSKSIISSKGLLINREEFLFSEFPRHLASESLPGILFPCFSGLLSLASALLHRG